MSISTAKLREKQADELATELTGLLRKRLKLSMSKANEDLKKTHEIAQVRKNIARILTIMREQEGNKL